MEKKINIFYNISNSNITYFVYWLTKLGIDLSQVLLWY